jgi:hypothetical protein
MSLYNYIFEIRAVSNVWFQQTLQLSFSRREIAVFAETLINTKHSTQLLPENQSYTSNVLCMFNVVMFNFLCCMLTQWLWSQIWKFLLVIVSWNNCEEIIIPTSGDCTWHACRKIIWCLCWVSDFVLCGMTTLVFHSVVSQLWWLATLHNDVYLSVLSEMPKIFSIGSDMFGIPSK